MKKVIYTGATNSQVLWGGNDDPRGVLVDGRGYELERAEQHTWHTKYILKEYPDLKFNSVCFQDE